MFEVQSSIRSQTIEVAVRRSYADLGQAPGLRLVRKRLEAAAAAESDGLVVFDAHRQLGDPAAPAAYCRRVRGVTTNAAFEGGLAEFELWEAHPTEPPAEAFVTTPSHVHLDLWYNGQPIRLRFSGAITAGKSVFENPQYTVTSTGYYIDGAHLFTTHIRVEEGEPRRLTLERPNLPNIFVYYDAEETHVARTSMAGPIPQGPYELPFTWSRGGEALITGTIRNAWNDALSNWELDIALFDASPSRAEAPIGLDPQSYYYYSLWVDDAPGPDGPAFDGAPTATAAAMATGAFGEGERMYRALPSVHRTYDEPDPEVQGQGQLRRLLSVFGDGLDQARGFADGLERRNDVLTAPMASLPPLARWIGWDVDRTNAGGVQRRDVLFAPRCFERAGTRPILEALIRRSLGRSGHAWPFVIREFADNVFFTNARPTGHWDIWSGTSMNGQTFGQAAGRDNQDPRRLAGRPAAAVDGVNSPWLVWHDWYEPARRRELWVRWPNDGWPALRIAKDDVLADPHCTDESPALVAEAQGLRLFWSSNRDGAWNIWTRTLPNAYAGGVLAVGAAEQVTNHGADDRSPAAVVEAGGRLWLFWQSNRRGPVDIWARPREGGVWGVARRVTTADIAHQTPTAALDGEGFVHLFFSSLTPQGSRLFETVLSEGAWSEPMQVTSADDLGHYRDEAPCAVLFQDKMHLFWHSNRAGRWQLWCSVLENGSWQAPFKVEQQIAQGLVNTHMVAAKEPCVIQSGAGLRGFWRAQRRGEARVSRTVNTADAAAVDAINTLSDWNHYTYDTARDRWDWYATDTIGVHITLPPEINLFSEAGSDYALVMNALERVKALVEPLLPVTTRVVFFAGMFPIA